MLIGNGFRSSLSGAGLGVDLGSFGGHFFVLGESLCVFLRLCAIPFLRKLMGKFRNYSVWNGVWLHYFPLQILQLFFLVIGVL